MAQIEKNIYKRKQAIREFTFSSVPKHSIPQVLEMHLGAIQKEVRPSTYAVYQGHLGKYISQYFKDTSYEQLTAETLQAFADWLLESGLSAATAQTILAFIKRGFEGTSEQSIFAVDLPKHTRQEIDYLTV